MKDAIIKTLRAVAAVAKVTLLVTSMVMGLAPGSFWFFYFYAVQAMEMYKNVKALAQALAARPLGAEKIFNAVESIAKTVEMSVLGGAGYTAKMDAIAMISLMISHCFIVPGRNAVKGIF